MSQPRLDLSVEDGLGASWDSVRIEALVQSIVSTNLKDVVDWTLAIHLVSEHTIRELNAAHRGKDGVTDVLSFPLLDRDSVFPLPPGEPAYLGDVVVCFPRAVDQAREFGHSVDRELAYLVAHGVLHVLGYDHERPEEQRVMREKEEEALRPLGFTR